MFFLNVFIVNQLTEVVQVLAKFSAYFLRSIFTLSSENLTVHFW